MLLLPLAIQQSAPRLLHHRFYNTADALISFLSARGVTGAAGVAGFVGVAGVVASGNFTGTDSSAINTSSVVCSFQEQEITADTESDHQTRSDAPGDGISVLFFAE